MSDFGSFLYPIAAKDHRCEWCGEMIRRGEKHFKYTGMWEGDFQNWRMHLECEFIYQRDNDGDGFSPYEGERPEIEVLVACPS